MSYTPVVTDAWRLVRAPFGPGAVFEEQKDKTTFWIPWAIVTVLFGVMQFLMTPFGREAQRLAMQQRGQLLTDAQLDRFATIGLAATPLITLVLMVVGAALIWALVLAVGEDSSFRFAMCITVFAWPVAIFQQLASFGVLSMRGVQSITAPADVRPSFGLDLLLPADVEVAGFLETVLAGVNPFSIWTVAITAIGIQVLFKLSGAKSWSVAIAAAVIGLLISAALATVFGR